MVCTEKLTEAAFTKMAIYLADFQVLRPSFEYNQETILSWLSTAHTRSEATKHPASFDADNFKKQLHERLRRLGLGEGKIKTRGIQRADIASTDWDPELLNPCISKKTQFFGEAIDQFFEDLYPESENLPQDLIHVTCTGYLSPSGAQKLVAKRKASTIVTHAYHMGCYAAISALRIAKGLLASSSTQGRADIVHTGLCSLHMDIYSHTSEQLVIQSLFGDGCIRYSLSLSASSCCFSIMALRETTLSNSAHAMTWQPTAWGMQMNLKKEVPFLIANSIVPTLENLAKDTGISLVYLQKNAIFAIHPGGPKIIEKVVSLLNLQTSQYQHSYQVLERYGNMSSATLPHIWETLLQDDAIPHGTLIVSLAFGPGLTIASSLMEKRKLL